MAFGGSVSQLAALTAAEEEGKQNRRQQALLTLAGDLRNEVIRRDQLRQQQAQHADELGLQKTRIALEQERERRIAADAERTGALQNAYLKLAQDTPSREAERAKDIENRNNYAVAYELATQGLGESSPSLSEPQNKSLAAIRDASRKDQEAQAAAINTGFWKKEQATPGIVGKTPVLEDYAAGRYQELTGVDPKLDPNFSVEAARWAVGTEPTGWGTGAYNTRRNAGNVATERFALDELEGQRASALNTRFDAYLTERQKGSKAPLGVVRAPGYAGVLPAYKAGTGSTVPWAAEAWMPRAAAPKAATGDLVPVMGDFRRMEDESTSGYVPQPAVSTPPPASDMRAGTNAPTFGQFREGQVIYRQGVPYVVTNGVPVLLKPAQ